MAESAPYADIERLADTPAKLELLLESDRWEPQRRADWRQERLERLLHCARRTTYGREALTAGRLTDLPTLDRHGLRRHADRLRGEGRGPVIRRRTSGSTGEPVEVDHGAETVGWSGAARLRQQAWFGLPPRELPVAQISTVAQAGDPPVKLIGRRPRTFKVNPFALEPEHLAEQHRRIVAEGGVDLLGARSSILAEWARRVAAAPLRGADLGARLAIIGGEATDPSQRERVANTFGCQVAEMYGSFEALMIATECPGGSLHVNEEVVWLELLGPGGEPVPTGELGEVVVTLLHNPEFPLVRYRLGDVARLMPGSCSCGVTLPRLELSVARAEEMVVRADGRLMHSRFLRTIYEARFGERLRGFHTFQEELDRFVVYLDLERAGPGVNRDHLADEIAAYTGRRAEVTVVLEPGAADRGRSPSGKLASFTRRRGLMPGDRERPADAA